tara:strand:+ start:1585 stop:2064 length:480 start_codon:yes stop_codon:yes gene_type:complete
MSCWWGTGSNSPSGAFFSRKKTILISNRYPRIVNAYLLHESLQYLWGMNKSFLFLLALYTIIISSLPCQDDIFKSWHQQSDFEVALETAHSSQNESMGLDLCSPFCICSCCSVPTSTAPLTELPALLQKQIDTIQLFTYQSTFTSTDFSFIWQPPKNNV